MKMIRTYVFLFAVTALLILNTGCMMMPMQRGMSHNDKTNLATIEQPIGIQRAATEAKTEATSHATPSEQEYSDSSITVWTVLGAIGMAAMMIVMML